MKTLTDYYTQEDKARTPSPIWIDEPFYRAFDDGVTALQVTRQQYRMLYQFGTANHLLSISDDGHTYVFGVKLIIDVPRNNSN